MMNDNKNSVENSRKNILHLFSHIVTHHLLDDTEHICKLCLANGAHITFPTYTNTHNNKCIVQLGANIINYVILNCTCHMSLSF